MKEIPPVKTLINKYLTRHIPIFYTLREHYNRLYKYQDKFKAKTLVVLSPGKWGQATMIKLS